MYRQVRGWIAAVVLALAAVGIVPARGQDGGGMVTISGALTSEQPEADVEIRVNAGAALTLTLSSADFDPWLRVYDAAHPGALVAENDDNDTGLALANPTDAVLSRIAEIDMTLIVSIAGQTTGDTGRYTLTIEGAELLGWPDDAAVSYPTGNVAAGTLSAEAPQAEYLFRASTGAPITLAAESAFFDTTLRVLGPGGEEVAANDDHDLPDLFLANRTDSAVRFTAPADGIYAAIVESFNEGEGGRFVVTISGAEFGLGESVSGRLRGDPPYVVNGVLGPELPYLEYRLYAAQGAELLATLVSDAFNAVLEIYSADGVRLADNDDHGPEFNLPRLQDAAVRLPISQAGMIAVRVRSFAGGGPFTLSMEGPGIAADEPPDPPLPPCEDVSSDVRGDGIAGFSSEFGGRWLAAYLNDGDQGSGWASGAGTEHARTEYVILDLRGDVQTIDGIRINPAATGGDSDVNSTSRFAVLVSTTDATKPESFVEVFSTLLDQRYHRMLAFGFAPVEARYVMLQTRDNFGGGWHSVAEFTVCAAQDTD